MIPGCMSKTVRNLYSFWCTFKQFRMRISRAQQMKWCVINFSLLTLLFQFFRIVRTRKKQVRWEEEGCAVTQGGLAEV